MSSAGGLQKKRKAAVQKESAETQEYESCRQNDVGVDMNEFGFSWTLLAINMHMSLEEIMSSGSSSKKGPAHTRLARKRAHTTRKATAHFHPWRPCENLCFHKQRV